MHRSPGDEPASTPVAPPSDLEASGASADPPSVATPSDTDASVVGPGKGAIEEGVASARPFAAAVASDGLLASTPVAPPQSGAHAEPSALELSLFEPEQEAMVTTAAHTGSSRPPLARNEIMVAPSLFFVSLPQTRADRNSETVTIAVRHMAEYYVIGRRKDLIIVAGKNLYPEDVCSEVAAGES